MSESRTVFDEFFPHRVCINLDRRPERWEKMQTRLEAAGLGAVDRFPAVDGGSGGVPSNWPYSSGAYGCLRSHLAVVEEARAQGWESILIMEDDVVFAEGFHEEFQQRLCGLPADWDMLFFGCLHYEPPEPAAPGIGRLRVSFSTFMYAVRRTVYDAFIFLNRRERYPVDKNNLFLQRRFRCYCFMPHLAWVDDSYSDAQGVPCTHWYIRDSMALGGDRMKAVERRTAAIIPYLETGNLERSVRNLRYVARAIFNPPRYFVRSVTMNWKCSLLPISPSFGEQTHAVHLWNEMWRRGGRDKRIVHGPGCLYERLKQAYGFASVIAS
jgi:glycosyl transferase, family 25